MRQSLADSVLPLVASASTAFTGRPPARPSDSADITCGASASAGRRVISAPSALYSTRVG